MPSTIRTTSLSSQPMPPGQAGAASRVSRRMRLTVYDVFEYLAGGMSIEEVIPDERRKLNRRHKRNMSFAVPRHPPHSLGPPDFHQNPLSMWDRAIETTSRSEPVLEGANPCADRPTTAIPPPSFPRTRESESHYANHPPYRLSGLPPLIPAKAGIHPAYPSSRRHTDRATTVTSIVSAAYVHGRSLPA